MNDVQIRTGGRLSLAERLARGKMPGGEALRYASLLAESLRKAHDEGRVHGFLTPSVIWLNGPAVELSAPPPGQRTLTPYTAPEQLLGKPADRCADIFSFGAIFYEMLTGLQAFTGDSQAQLAQSLRTSQPPSTGSAGADKLLAGCLAKDPAGRWQQVQKVLLELKLLRLVAHKANGRRAPAGAPAAEAPVAPAAVAEPTLPAFPPPAAEKPAPRFTPAPLPTPAAPFRNPATLPPTPAPFQPPAAPLLAAPESESAPLFPDLQAQSLFRAPAQPAFPAPLAQPVFPPLAGPADFAAIRSEMQQSENRLGSRLQLGEKAMTVLNRAVADALTGLRSQISALTSQMAALQKQSNLGLLANGDSAIPEAALARIEQSLQAFGARMEIIEKGIGVLRDRMARTEQDAQAARQQVNALHTSMAQDFVEFEQSLQKQEHAVDSARTAMAQTDALVERLAEALEALQATVLQRSEEWTARAN